MAMYETQEVQSVIPESVRSVLWFMVQELDNPDPNHRFELSVAETNQKVVHTQQNTGYHREFSFKCPEPINRSVYIVGFGTNNWLMLLQP
jgi:hypothetical protein